MNGESVGGLKSKTVNRRLDGHRIRVDVILSALQKGIRRCEPNVSLWALALLCRANMWLDAFYALVQCFLEETNALTEPYLREPWIKMARRLLPQLNRKGVDLNTDTSRKLMFELCLDATLATKSRMAVHSMMSAYATVVDEAKDLRGVLPLAEDEMLLYLFKQFKKCYDEKDEVNALKWLTVLDLFGENNSVYGTPKVWRFLSKKGDQVDRVDELRLLSEDGYLRDVYVRRVILYEAVLFRFYPVRVNSPELKQLPSLRTSVNQKTVYATLWKSMWDGPLDYAVRGMINWNVWHSIILDISTA